MPQSQDYDRRSFLRSAGITAAAAAVTGVGRATAHPAFEVSASLYAWDLHDEGIEKILDNLQQMAAVNSVYLITPMHYERRPLTSPEFPHNPVRKFWQAEDSRVYWHPDMKRYGRIKPRVSDFTWLNQTDWLAMLVEAARKRGLKTGVEHSHTVLDAERCKGEFRDCVQRDINGSLRVLSGRYAVCPNNPDAREYILNMFSELAARYDVDYIQTCTFLFMPGGADRGGCFCDSCGKTAKEFGFDLAKAKAVLSQNHEAQPEFDLWQNFRRQSLARYYKVMHDGIHALRKHSDFRFNDTFPRAAQWGLDLKLLKPHLDSIRVCDYSEQQGDPARMKEKREWLTREREAMGQDFPILSALGVRPKATPELIREGIRIALECGMNGIALGHYDGAEFPMLRAVREALGTAGKLG